MRPHRLDNPVRHYAWGSRAALPALLGHAPSGRPEAELWLGTHPRAPSRLIDGTPLSEWVASAAEAVLGAAVARRRGTLPFLLKVLAVAHPLSVQVHPDDPTARAGFAAEVAAGLSTADPRRAFPDPHGKPELLVALSSFDALCGLRDPSDLAALLRALGIWPDLTAAPEGALDAVLASGPERAEALAAALEEDGPRQADRVRLRTLRDRFPGDAGLACAALLRPVHLDPGEALLVPPGVLHAYLRGVGVEIQAASDNVARAGCTAKPTAPAEVTRLSRRTPGGGVRWDTSAGGTARSWETPDLPFRLGRIDLGPGTAGAWTAPPPASAEILLCTAGELVLQTRGARPTALWRGQSVVIPASAGAWTLRGTGTVFRAAANARVDLPGPSADRRPPPA